MKDATYVNKTQTIEATASLVLPDRSSLKQKRVSLIITNISAASVIWLGIDAEAKVGAGIPLYAGGSWERTATEKIFPPQKQVTAICSVQDGDISVFEEVYNE